MVTKFTAEDFKSGQLLLMDKPLKWTSFQVVKKVRWLIKQHCGIRKIKVGHAGTLDPLATGLLLICTGKYTKKIQDFQGMEKEYVGTITFGGTTPSYDLETEIDKEFSFDHIAEKDLQKATQNFIGEIAQHPPVFSALKKNGKRLYEYARAGEKVKTNARTITINRFDLTRVDLPEVDFKVQCGKGTYIRSLAYDYGEYLNSGAHLSALRRTKTGKYTVEDALSIEDFTELLPDKKEA